ncbi:hypothetical protein ALC56_15338, partial [Trachymyrmex septentrionalis]
KKHYDKKINLQKFKPGDHVFLLKVPRPGKFEDEYTLMKSEECDIPPQNVNSSKVYIQVLQLNNFKSVKVIQCKIEIDRTVKRYGMFSHTMDVYNGQFSYIADLIEGGDTFWNPVPIDHCRASDYGVLYNELANKILDATNERSQIVYSIIMTNMILFLTSTCGYTLIRTSEINNFRNDVLAEVFKSSESEVFKNLHSNKHRYLLIYKFKIHMRRKTRPYSN